ncbi:MAG: DMT family transporter [Acidobacteriota bacterium]
MAARDRVEEGESAPAEASSPRMTATDLALLLTVCVWGVNFSIIKFALAEMPPLAFNTVRFLAASLVVGSVARAAGYRWRIQKRHWPMLIGLGLVGNSLYQMLFVYGAEVTTAANAALLLGTVPVWVALAGTLLGMERLRPGGWLGVGLSLLGIVLIIVGGDRGADFRFGGATLRGDILVFAATLCWSAYTLLVRLAMRHYRPMTVTSFCTVMGALPLVLVGLPELAALDHGQISVGAWTAAVFSGAVSIGLAYFVWNHGISRLGSARTALYSNLVPGFALVTAWLWLGETLTALQGWGALLAICGVVLARRNTRAVES